MKYVVAMALLTGVMTVVGAAQAEACDCAPPVPPPLGMPAPPPPTEAALEQQVQRARDAALAVFTGKAVKRDRLTVTFEVEKNWKGAAETTVSMSNGYVEHSDGSLSRSSCAFFFEEGETYLVFAYGKSRADMRADGVCNTFTTGRLADRSGTVRRLDSLRKARK